MIFSRVARFASPALSSRAHQIERTSTRSDFMNSFSRLIGAALLIALTTGCANTAVAGKGALPSGGVTHVVIMNLYDRGDLGARKEVINAAEKLREIGTVRTIWAGR